jgi:hypothetical protein
MWYRKCPICNSEVNYSNKRCWYNANRSDAKCKECQNKENSKYWKGRVKPNYPSKRRSKLQPTEYIRNCPDCDKMLYYANKYNLNEALNSNTVCDGCANYKYEKTWNDVITEDHIKSMRASKAGFSSWEEYEQKYPKKKAYINEVHKLTRKQPLHTLSNYSKLEENWGMMGEDGAYQIDHIISIDQGWKEHTPPEEISNISNLQVMKWEDNRKKGYK